MQAERLLQDMGLDASDAMQRDAELSSKRGRNPFICICGHPESRHTVIGESVYCRPSKLECHCPVIQRVVRASDTRVFVRKTNGYGREHALTRGLAAAAKKQIEVDWVPGLECASCRTPRTTAPLQPLMVEFEQLTRQPSLVRDRNTRKPYDFAVEGQDYLLCPRCLDDLVLREDW